MDKINKSYILFLITIISICIAAAFLQNIADYDLWARLLVGQHIVETGTFMRNDIFSYTPTHTWYDHEWGASVIFYIVFKYFGQTGLILLKGILLSLIFIIINKTIELRSDKTIDSTNIFYYIVALLALMNVAAATIRCHLFTFVFFTLWIYLLERIRRGEKKWIFYFPIMMVFWNNIHGGCVSGIGLLAIYILGEALDKKPVKDLLFSLAATCIALIINPFGLQYLFFLIKATTMKRPLIAEWRGSFDKALMFSLIKFKIFLLISTLTIAIKAVTEKINYIKADKTKIILLLITAYLAIAHVKHQPFFVITAAIFLYEDFFSLLKKFKLNISNPQIKINKVFIYSLVILFSLLAIDRSYKEIPVKSDNYPIYQIDFIKQNNLKGNIFVNFQFGSYVIYKLFPNNLVVMDGRYEEVYNDDLLPKIRDFHLLKGDNWKKIITDYKTDIIILEKKYPVYKVMLEDKDWKLIFSDERFGLFLPIKGLKKQYIAPNPDLRYYQKTSFDSSVKFKKD